LREILEERGCGLTMRNRRLIGALLSCLMLSVPMSGCTSEIENILGESWGVPGGLALACLRDDSYKEMVIEIDHAPGYNPETSTVNLLKQRLGQVCDKPDGIRIELTEVTFAESETWTADKVRDIAHETMDSPPQTSVLRWHVIMPQGKYSDDSVLGVAVDASTIALFPDSIEDATSIFNPRISAEDIENSVMVHEFGHLLGLVNLVYTSPADHEDSEHPGHSNNEDSVMYWAVETVTISAFFSGDLPTEFDQDDLDDLEGMKSGELETSDQLWRP
tara:strand:+ start:12474 stop:13301 length:828 start_codon:yes stop_codon:yes gene_type:complete